MKVLALTSAEQGNNFTIIGYIIALGNSVQPCLIFPRFHFKDNMINGAPLEILGLATPIG